ncbi:MAG: diguanylate cyclase domain-containing protein, partial [Acidimicrobiales bacterium]
LDHTRAATVGGAVPVWTPSSPGSSPADPEAWLPEDELLAPLVSPRDGLTGVLSVDLPVSGRRPDADQRELLEMFAAQAQLAIENARLLAAVEAARQADVSAQARRLEALVAAAPVGIVELDREGRVRTWNPAAERLYGRPGPGVLGRLAADVGQEDPAVGQVLEHLGAWAELDRHVLHQERLGRPAEMELSTAVVPDAGQPRGGVLGVVTDVTERHRLQDELRVRAAQQAVVAGIGQQALTGAPLPRLLKAAVRVVTDTLGARLVSVHELVQDGRELRVRAGTGWPPGYVGQKRLGADSRTPAALALRAQGPVVIDDLAADPEAVDARDCLARGARSSACVLIGDGPWGVLAAHAGSPASFSPEDLDFLQSVANVIGAAVERHRVEAETRHQALHDPLTGLANRALLRERVERAISSAEHGHWQVGLVLLDLDGFKDVNDALGHDRGDLLLCQVARRLSRTLRRGDTLARLGGDEFAACLRRLPAGAGTDGVAQRLLEAFAEPFQIEGSAFRLTASMGLARYPDHAATCSELLRRADLAMYRAKGSDTGWVSYDSDRDESPAARLPLTGALRRGLESDELSLHYQPVVSLATGEVSHVEALARWRHPTLGWIAPDQFILLAEQTGVIRSLTRWVLREAAFQAAAWRDAGCALPIAVNLSAVDLE